VGRRHGRGQSAEYDRDHALEVRRSHRWSRQHRYRLAVQRRTEVKIRLINEMDSDHPMHHPFHLHGAGRFLVLARDGRVEPNLVWKDTVLIRTGQTVDILFDVSNPGLWMAHCHIAEHMQSGMMFSFTVSRR
jgi:FtsP/CotA-like multicopper oxidase with cupredoxin domain